MLEEHLSEALRRYEEVMAELSVPETHRDSALLQRLLKEQAELSPLVSCVEALRSAEQREAEALSMLGEEKDEELRALAKEELWEARREKEAQAAKLKELLLPKDPNDEKNVVLDFHESGLGGMKEVIATVRGRGAFSRLKFESGVHRVQRVPATEAGGRIHTSTASVAVMPEAEEVDVQLDLKDVRIDVMRASGNGGQCVNTTDSAVRLTHYPTGIVIYSQTEKSQLQNKEKAFRLLRSKLYALELERRQNETAEARRAQIGSGDRSEKIRTYNFPQGRVTDHRIKLTLYNIERVMDGDLDEILDALIHASRAAELAGSADSESAGKGSGNSL